MFEIQTAFISRRYCPTCRSHRFYWDYTTIGEAYELCKDCGYCEKERDPKRYKKIGNKPFNSGNYVEDPDGEYHNHKRKWHKISIKHKRVEGELYSFEELADDKGK